MVPEMIPAAIALGSNLGDRGGYLRSAFGSISRLPGTALVLTSSLHETVPVGGVSQGSYLNAAATVRTGLTPRELLEGLLAIEKAHGRERSKEVRWGPRTLDLDLILYDDRLIEEPGLAVPHPRMHEREFVLRPLAEIAPEWVVPGRGRSVADLLARLTGCSVSAPDG